MAVFIYILIDLKEGGSVLRESDRLTSEYRTGKIKQHSCVEEQRRDERLGGCLDECELWEVRS